MTTECAINWTHGLLWWRQVPRSHRINASIYRYEHHTGKKHYYTAINLYLVMLLEIVTEMQLGFRCALIRIEGCTVISTLLNSLKEALLKNLSYA